LLLTASATEETPAVRMAMEEAYCLHELRSSVFVNELAAMCTPLFDMLLKRCKFVTRAEFFNSWTI
jgi:hypothetical protein